MTRERFISEVRACQGSLRRFLASLCGGDTSRADDLAQEALVRAYVNSDGFSGNFKAWLYRIAYNCFIDSTRRTPLPSVDIDSASAAHISAADGTDAAFRREELLRALQLIPEKERTAVILHYFEDLPAKDIAAVMHAPIGSVLYWLSSGRKHLKQHIRL